MSPSSTSVSELPPEADVPAGETAGLRTAGARPARYPARRRALLVTLAVALAVAAVAEGVVRSLPALPPPQMWNDVETDTKARALRQRAARGQPTDVVYLGSSIMDAAVDPAVVDEVSRRAGPGYNAALEGADARSMIGWATEVVVPATTPRIVVFGVSPREFNDHGTNQQEFADTFFGSRGWREASGQPTWSDRVTAAAEDRSALVRSRARLRDPYNSVQHWQGRTVGAWSAPVDPETGRLLRYQDDPPYLPIDENARTEVFNDFSVGGRQAEALRQGIAALQEQGITVVLVVPSRITADLQAVLPPDDLARAQRELEAISAELCAPLIDLSDALPDQRLFVDAVHTNGRGTEAESRLLGRRLDGLPAPAFDDPGC